MNVSIGAAGHIDGPMEWTEKADRLLIRLWNEGGSLGTIAADLRKAGYHDANRNKVAGRKSRLPPDLFSRERRPPTPTKLIQRSKPEVTQVTVIKKPMKPIEPPPPLPEIEGVHYHLMRENQCKAILDKRGGPWNLPMVCGEPRTTDHLGSYSPYCAMHHRAFTNQPGQPRR